MIFQTRPRLNMKNNRKRLSFKLDQAGLKTIRDSAWACKHAQQSQYKHPATAFSLASWILDIHSHSAKCITSLSEKASRKFQAPKQLDAKKNVCSANARTKRRSESLLHLSSQVSDQLILFHICGVVIINVMLVVLSSTAKKYQHQYAAPFFKWVFFLPAVENYHTVRYCSNFSFYAMPNNLLLLWTELHCYWFNENILVSKCSKKEWLDVQPGQVQNLTPQLVNAGTIKMTYPENKVAMTMMMLMVVLMMLMMVFFEDHKNDSISKISVPNGDDQS